MIAVTLSADSSGVYYSPAIDTTGYNNVNIYVSSSQYADVTVMTSPDGGTWTTLGTMSVGAGSQAVYTMAVTTKFFRYSVATDGTPESTVALI